MKQTIKKINNYSFNLYNSLASCGIQIALKKQSKTNAPPIILCIGSDLSVGDSLGPVVGTKLKERLNKLNCFIYGTLTKPITAHEVKYINEFLHQTHPQSPILAIDAAVGNDGDIGLIRVIDGGLKPGSGSNKKLNAVGDIAIMGIVAEKSLFNYSILTATRLNLVYKMADIIADGVSDYMIELLQNSPQESKKEAG